MTTCIAYKSSQKSKKQKKKKKKGETQPLF